MLFLVYFCSRIPADFGHWLLSFTALFAKICSFWHQQPPALLFPEPLVLKQHDQVHLTTFS